MESATVPKFTASINGLLLKEEGNGTEPLGNRIVEMAESTYDTNILRNPRSGFVVYAPIGSVKKGERLVTTGGSSVVDGKTVPGPTRACGTCHGQDLRGGELRGVGRIPAIAGRSASAIGRQLYDMQQGARKGAGALLMKTSVEKLTNDDLIAIAAYVSSLQP